MKRLGVVVAAVSMVAGLAGAMSPWPAQAGYLNGLDFGERCFRAGGNAGASLFPGVPSRVGFSEHGCVSDSTIRQTGVLEATADGAGHNVPFGPYSAGGGVAGHTTTRAGVQRIAWLGGTVSHTFYLAHTHAAGPATVCATVRDFDGVLLAKQCQPLADGAVTISVALAPQQYHEAAVELIAEYSALSVNKAVATVTRYTSLLP